MVILLMFLKIYTNLNDFKFKLSKIFWGGAHRDPSPDPSLVLSRALPPAEASSSILGGFASSNHAYCTQFAPYTFEQFTSQATSKEKFFDPTFFELATPLHMAVFLQRK